MNIQTLNALSQHKKELKKKIQEAKEQTQRATGAFKYDWCYDEIIILIDKS